MQLIIIFISIVSLLIIAALISMIVSIYNSLISNKENISKAWANIDVILKQRYDEIPQLITMCNQYVKFESKMIERIMECREKMVKGKNVQDIANASDELSKEVKGIFAIGEGYPELKSNTQFLQIQTRLSSLEEKLADRREYYNNSVTVYNTRIQQFPDVLFANMMGATRKELFEIPESQKTLPSLEVAI